MKFKLSTSAGIYSDEEEIKKLKKLGFRFQKGKSKSNFFKEDDRFIEGAPTIEFSSLKELMNFIKKWGRIVLDEGTIEIYDDWRE